LYAQSVGTFVEGIYNDVRWDFMRDCKNVVEALYKCGITGLLQAKMMCRIEAVKNVAERIRSNTELDKNGGK
jgi:hypothetical protein